jgi:hypothetical protein
MKSYFAIYDSNINCYCLVKMEAIRRYIYLCLTNYLYPQKLAVTSPTSGGRSRTQATEFFSISLTN